MASTLLREYIALRKLIWVGTLTIVFTVIANLIIRTIAFRCEHMGWDVSRGPLAFTHR
jgi:hypothetical protein